MLVDNKLLMEDLGKVRMPSQQSCLNFCVSSRWFWKEYVFICLYDLCSDLWDSETQTYVTHHGHHRPQGGDAPGEVPAIWNHLGII